MYKLLHHGVLVDSGHALETAGDITTVMFDKTGTITEGNRRATEFVPIAGTEEWELMAAAALASLEDPTPEGRSTVELAAEHGVQPGDFDDGDDLGRGVAFSAHTRMSGRDLPGALLLHRLRRLALACIAIPSAEHGGLRGGDIGIGWAHTARGLLLHLARLEQGNVSAYRILPPTFWNAAPGGLMAAALTGLAAEQAARCAEQLLLLLDPCAPFEIEVAPAD
jgi:hypothetical protein